MKPLKNFFFYNYLSITLFCFAILICQFTGNRGILPIDSTGAFDSGYRILNGDHPFKDYWVITGPMVDYLSSLIFLIFGNSWQNYLLSASIFNGLISLATFYLFINLGLEKKLSFIYSICFAVLAYPSSGTPFIEHHSAFFSILSLYALIIAMQRNKLFYWSSIPFLMMFAFLSKQVPATYVLLVIILVTILHLIHQTKKDFINIFISLSLSSLSIIGLMIIFFKSNSIEIKSFLIQYLYYPSALGNQRYDSIIYDFKNVFLNYKFIYFSLLIFAIFSIKNLDLKKNFYQSKDFKILIICLLLFFSLAQHMIITKNQIYIYFLIPLFIGLANIQLFKAKHKYSKYLTIFMVLFCLGITLKYHYRFNIERKFHELNNVNFSDSEKGDKISNKLAGLNWITPKTTEKTQIILEIQLMKDFIKILKNEKSNVMVITNYSIFSSIIEKNVSGYSRWYPGDNSAFPKIGDKYFNNYKKFIISKLDRKQIQTIYVLPDVSEGHLTNYIDRKCLTKETLNQKIKKFTIDRNCKEFLINKN